MINLSIPVVLAAMLGLVGCQTDTQTLDNESNAAIQTALSRAKFELSCPGAQGSVLSRNLIHPAINGPMYQGVERAEYTIGVSGCGQKATYIALCQVGSVSCVTGEGRSAGS
jgi:hypothetical protein